MIKEIIRKANLCDFFCEYLEGLIPVIDSYKIQEARNIPQINRFC